MDIEVSTKFNIGDSVYFPEFLYGEYYSSMQYIVRGVRLIFDADKMMIEYTVQCGDSTYDLIESMCFRSYDECKEWCTNRNQEEKENCSFNKKGEV